MCYVCSSLKAKECDRCERIVCDMHSHTTIYDPQDRLCTICLFEAMAAPA